MPKTFLCHASEDKELVVEPLYHHLRELGIPTWYDRAELFWGDSLTEKLNQGLSESDHVIVVLSQHFHTKNWPQRELNSVLHADAAAGSPKILPLIVGHETVIDRILATYPLLRDKYFIHWDSTPLEQIGYELTRLTSDRFHKERPEPVPSRFGLKELSSTIEPQATHYCVEQAATGEPYGALLDLTFLGTTPIHRNQLRLIDESQQYGLYSSLFWSLGRSIARGDYLIGSDDPIFISIDVDPSVLNSVLGNLADCARHWGIDQNRITALFPEPMLNTWHDAESFLRQDHWKYLQFGLMDFGTGYSSLSYLKALPLQYLFVDQGFFNDASEDSMDASIVRTVGQLGRSLGITVGATLPSAHWTYQRLTDTHINLTVQAIPKNQGYLGTDF